MNSKKKAGKPFNAGSSASASSGRGNATDNITRGVAGVHLDSVEGGEWEVYARKLNNKNMAAADSTQSWGQPKPNFKAWGDPDVVSKLGMRDNAGPGKASGGSTQMKTADPKAMTGRGNANPQQFNKGLEGSSAVPPAVISPPLAGGWNWHSRPGASQQNEPESVTEADIEGVVDDGSESDAVDNDEYDDDDVYSDDFDSDESQKSHETQKKNKWYKSFFDILDTLTVDEIRDPERQWHCPACQGGPGAIDWYRGLQPLMAHANTKGAQRVKIHRDFATLLNEEIQRKGGSIVPAGEAFGRWKGLENQVKDHAIVWPPMVIIMNTRHERDEKDNKWIGMGNQELMEYFSSYAVLRARHSYGPQGHRGIGLLFFEPSAVGYLEAERLHKHFETQGRDRYAWERHPVYFHPGGVRQLFGFLASKKDMDDFNFHAQGKTKVKYEMRSYIEAVVSEMKKMNEDNQQLLMYKDKVNRAKRHSKELEKSFGAVSERLRKTMEENRIVKQRTKIHYEQNKGEMDSQEQFFKEQLETIHEARDAKEEEFEKLQQEKREKVKLAITDPSSGDKMRRSEEVEKFISCQEDEMEAFVEERERLMKVQDHMKVELKRRHMEEELKLEEQFNAELTQLMEKYAPSHGASHRPEALSVGSSGFA